MGAHTDVLLGRRATTPDEMEQLQAEALRRQTREAKDQLKAIQELLACPGWQVFKDYCASEHQAIMAKLEQTTDATTLAKLVGVNLAVESFPLWPERYARELVETLSEG